MKPWSELALAVALGSVAALLSAGGTRAVNTAPAASARAAADPAPVASLEPAETNRLWRHLVATRSQRARASADCRPVRAIFYAATDFLRLATKLAAAASPCAQYYITVPPLVADKTKPRPNAAGRIRALGPNFHAMAEFHFATWTRWVASTGSSWYQAGVTLRERMAAAGYDVAKGDTWALNELNSAVRRGTGNARANVRDLMRGLYEGGGQPSRGAVLVIGVGQRTSDVSLYQTNLQSWFSDSAFWADMATYVSDWSQEVYGDVRSYAVPGVAENVRRDYLNDYLQHQIVLAGVAPPSVETARTFVRNTYSPLANAAWERETGYGWTMVPAEQMAAYVSGQVHALRYFSATTGQAQDRWGFAWAPRNGSGASAADFAAQSGLVLDRLAAAVRDSAEASNPADPGSAACGPPGQNVYCLVDVEGASFNEAWKSFRTWTQPVLGFATPAQTIPAGSISAPISLALVTTTGLAVTTARHARGDGQLELADRRVRDHSGRPLVEHGVPDDPSRHAHDRRLLLPGSARWESRADSVRRRCDERHPDDHRHAGTDGRALDHARHRKRSCARIAAVLGRRSRCPGQHVPDSRHLVARAGDARHARADIG